MLVKAGRLFNMALVIAGALTITSSAWAQSTGRRSGTPDLALAGLHDMTLKPVRNGGAEVIAIAVLSRFNDAPTLTSPLSLTTPITYAGVLGIADRLEGLEVRDAKGTVSLTIEDDPPSKGGFPFYRHWRAQRDVAYPLTIAYRARVQPDGGPGGPPFGIRPTAGGVSGSGAGFLVLPENISTAKSKVHWDLSDLAPGSFAVTSFAEGDFEVEGLPERLNQGWYLAGPGGRFPSGGGDSHGYSAAWLGQPPYNPAKEMVWAGEAYTYLGNFFAYIQPPPRYRVFIRAVPPPNAGGTAMGASFMTAPRPGDGTADGPRTTFMHEMIHMWVGGIEGPRGVTSWFGEGLTTFYARLLAMRAGYISIDQYARDINNQLRVYYSSPGLNMSAQAIADVGFGQESVRNLPYERGSLYFVNTDAKIRAKSGGKRKLDDVTLPLFKRRSNGEHFDQAAWVGLVVKELGPDAKSEFQSIIVDGGTVNLIADAFGPCFQRQSKAYKDAAGNTIEGYEWVRAPNIPDEKCRQW